MFLAAARATPGTGNDPDEHGGRTGERMSHRRGTLLAATQNEVALRGGRDGRGEAGLGSGDTPWAGERVLGRVSGPPASGLLSALQS